MQTSLIASSLKRGCAVASVVASLLVAGCGDLYDRTDFTRLVQNKSEQEIRKAVGKPSTVDSSNPERVIWTYTTATFDPTNSNKRDTKTIVVLKPEKPGSTLRATEVLFE